MIIDFIQFILNPPFIWWITVLKIIFLITSVFFATFTLYFFFITKWLNLAFFYDFIEFFTMKVYGGVGASKKWKKLKIKALAQKEGNFHYIIFKSHHIFSPLLKRLVPLYQTNNYSERLARLGPETFSSITGLWHSYELYRELKANKELWIDKENAEKIIKIYDQAFRDLELF